jgi:type II secretory pathway component PulK
MQKTARVQRTMQEKHLVQALDSEMVSSCWSCIILVAHYLNARNSHLATPAVSLSETLWHLTQLGVPEKIARDLFERNMSNTMDKSQVEHWVNHCRSHHLITSHLELAITQHWHCISQDTLLQMIKKPESGQLSEAKSVQKQHDLCPAESPL